MTLNITLLRKNGLGLVGTYRNAHHHAQKVLPLIDALSEAVPEMNILEWKQGHNVHLLIAKDGRTFALRAFTKDGEYIGIRLSLRLSRSEEIFLYDAINEQQIGIMIKMLKSITRSMKGDETNLLCMENYKAAA